MANHWPELTLAQAPRTGESILAAVRWTIRPDASLPAIISWNPAALRWQSGAAGIEERAIAACWQLPEMFRRPQ